MNLKVAIDSNVLTYLVESSRSNYYPKADRSTLGLRSQRQSIYFLSQYLDQLYIPPIIRAEAEDIRHHRKKSSHIRFISFVLADILPAQCVGDAQRAEYLEKFHKKKKDCLALAQAEIAGMAVLLTYDQKFINHLEKHANLTLERPSSLWARMGIPMGLRPRWAPRKDNPLSKQKWRKR